MSESSIEDTSPREVACNVCGTSNNVEKLVRVTAILLPSGDHVGLRSQVHVSFLKRRDAAVTVISTGGTGSATVQSGVLSICVAAPPLARVY